jgi:hypothetical protein
MALAGKMSKFLSDFMKYPRAWQKLKSVKAVPTYSKIKSSHRLENIVR